MSSRTVPPSKLHTYIGKRISATWCDGWDDYCVSGVLISAKPNQDGNGTWVETCDDPTDCDLCPATDDSEMRHGGFLFQERELVAVIF